MTVYETLNTSAVPTSVTWKDVLTSATLELRVTSPHQQSQTSTTAGSTTAPARTEPVRPAPTPSRPTTGNITLDVFSFDIGCVTCFTVLIQDQHLLMHA
jgi:hypothetical protein